MGRPPDVIVIGAGIVGCAVAYELARRGASVEIIDDRPIGMGATQASAGVLAPYIEVRSDSQLLDLAVRSLNLYDEFVARVSADSGAAFEYRRTGTLDVALDETDLSALDVTATFLAGRDVPARLVDAAAATSEEPHLGDGVVGGLVVDVHGYVAAADLTRALVVAARRSGAQLIEPSRVRRIACRQGGSVVETDRGSLTCDAVVVAAGSWAADIEIEGVRSRVPVRPVRGQLLSLGWQGTPLRRVTWSTRCYLVPRDAGTVLVGATVEEAGFDERATVAGVRDLIEAASDLVPHIWAGAFNGARVGLRPGTPDDLPVIGRSSAFPNLIYATGHYRNGVLLAPLTAQVVAEELLDGRTDPGLSAVSPARFGRL
jgi:glycine oxidase